LEALTTLIDQRSDIEHAVFHDETNSPEPESQAFHLLIGLCIEAISSLGTVGLFAAKGHIAEVQSDTDTLSQQNLHRLIACLGGIGKLLKKAATSSPPLNKVSS
jgi:hypothetical protein